MKPSSPHDSRHGAGRRRLALTALVLGALVSCGDDETSPPEDGAKTESSAEEARPAPADAPPEAAVSARNESEKKAPPVDPDAPLLGARAYATIVYEKPSPSSEKLGYLRVGAKVARSAEAAGHRRCKGGWYAIQPRGYVCVGEDATIDVEDPLLRAAERRPRLDRPLPYRYGFVRAVLPLYLRVPTSQRQFKSEFKLKDHLEWFKEHRDEVQTAGLGAWDVPVDNHGRTIVGKRLGELGREKNSSEMNLGELFGNLDPKEDRWPFWLRPGERLIPNISGFQVPEYSVFADRARRHTGLAFVGSFSTDEMYLRRRFAITTDLRLAPTTKVKPDSASPWHGVEIGRDVNMPFVFANTRGVDAFSVGNGVSEVTGTLKRRSVHELAGKVRKVEGERYLKLKDGRWVKDDDVGLVVRPAKWPTVAKKGEKWIEVDISEQTLVLWEGQKAVFATLVSTGKPGIGDPEKTTATARGSFKIYAKHISATMDSDEGASKRKPHLKPGDPGYVATKGDGAYGKTLRRGHGLFKLRDVPHIQYFHKNYAIHGAYWHDVFGIPRSHGCINLAPADSLRVFMWTSPAVPDGWHGVNTENGTTVIVHK
jgi:lipoprotein-anchoring transpeptidase ErfK/SrfK